MVDRRPNIRELGEQQQAKAEEENDFEEVHETAEKR